MNRETIKKNIFFGLILGLFILLPYMASAELNTSLFSPASGNKTSEQEIVISGQPAKLIHYESNLSQRDILDFYYNSLTNQGWKVTKENRESGLIAFAKDNDSANIMVMNIPQRGKNDILITLIEDCPSCQGQEQALKPEEPEVDVVGEDLVSAPRYPGSLRILFLKTEIPAGITVIYKTQAGKEKILDFYVQKMAEGGWQEKNRMSMGDLKADPRFSALSSQLSKNIDADAETILYAKGNKTLMLSVMKSPQGSGTLITVKANE